MSGTLVSLEKVTLGYGNNAVLRDLNFSIYEGDFICIVGPNGAGKTTLIRGILGLIKPFSGKIKFIGLEQKFVGYMPQETNVDANFPASVFEIVLSGTLNRVGIFYRANAKKSAEKSLRLLRLEKLRDKNFSELSGGQRQRVLLARALAATKKILILDEPSNNLDARSKKELYELIRELNEKQNITILMITHDLDHGNLIGNKILSLRDDEIFFGSTSEFIKRVHHE